ncbi:type II toxin-antitoxin system HicA family toxin [Lactiplantibacillus dongliensis]|uniref:Type II toxin-antitoxin system HicA family toxin n=1 Tax=Lactiplantibacillus dongliensis TaxID=2559919 RepID=A0ABW1R6W8_9LACO|nr:type II toxin-antitoxin system HicA family toxin [Lactiplantibacillus dongliensis]
MTMKPRKLERLVLKAGFEYVPELGRGGHRFYRHPDGRTTEIPFHSKELKKGTEMKILKQISLPAK